MTIKFYIDLTN